MGRWVRAARTADIPEGGARVVQVEGRACALYRDPSGAIHATDDACPHQGASLGEGTYHEGRVICPQHAWVFDVRTGACLVAPGISVACYATRPAGEDVEIELPEETPCR